MTTITIAQPTTVTSRRPALALDLPLGRLEHLAARLPHPLAVPVMVLHAALSTIAYR